MRHLTSSASLLVRSGDPHGPDATCIHVPVHVGHASAPPAPLPPRNAREACGMAGESGSGPERRRLKGGRCQVLVLNAYHCSLNDLSCRKRGEAEGVAVRVRAAAVWAARTMIDDVTFL